MNRKNMTGRLAPVYLLPKKMTLLLELAVYLALPLVFITEALAAPKLSAYASITMASETQTNATGPVAAQSQGTYTSGALSAHSSADYGILRVFADGQSIGNRNTGGLLASQAEAFWQDTLTIDAPGLAGKTGTLTVKYTVDGSLTASGQAYTDDLRSYAKASFEFFHNTTQRGTAAYTVRSDASTLGTPFLGQERTSTFTFTYGTAFDIKLKILAQSRAYTYYSANAESDLSGTATWGGFVSVKDNNGDVVTDYTASSVSGANYVSSIVPPAPQLAVKKVGQELQLRWSTNFNDYKIEFSENLSSDSWTTVTDATSTNESEMEIHLPIGETPRFFRLRK